MTDKKVPKCSELSDLQESKRRGLVIDNGYSFVFSTDIRDWITQRKRRQELESREQLKNGKRKQ